MGKVFDFVMNLCMIQEIRDGIEVCVSPATYAAAVIANLGGVT